MSVASPPLSSPRVRDRTVLIVAAFGAFLAFLDATIVNVAFPSIRESFPTASISELSWVLNAYNIVFAAFLVPAGRMADLLGRRRAFAWGVATFTAASLFCGIAGSVGFLVAMRGVQALGAAILVPASLALVVEAFPSDRRTHAVGLWGASAAVAAALGPPLGGALVEWGNWRWAFLINIPFGLAAWWLARRHLVESRAPGRRRLPDLVGATLAALTLGLLTLALVQGNDWGWTSVGVLAAFGAAALCGVGFLVSSRSHPTPVLDPALLRIRPFAVSNLATIVGGFGFYAYLLTNILWLQYVWRYSVLESGLAVAPGALLAAVVAAVLSRVAEQRGYRPIIILGALVWTAAFVWYRTQVGLEPAFITEWLPGQILSGIGVGATLPLLASAGLAAVPGGRYATASAVVSSSRQLGGVLGIAVLVVIIGTPTPATAADSLRTAWVMCAVAFAAVAIITLFLGRIDGAQEGDPGADASRALVTLPTTPPDARGAAGLASGAALFARLPAAARERLESSAQVVDLGAGEWLFRGGDAADALYVITSGRLEAIRDGRVVADLGAGDIVGELALLTGAPRAAGIRARRDSHLLRLSSEAFEVFLAAEPDSARAVATALAEQIQATTPVSPGHPVRPSLVAVVGTHPGAPVAAVASALLDLLRRDVSVVALDHPTPDSLDRAEADHDRVILTAESDDLDWWGRCVAHADHLVVVSAADAPVPAAGTVPRAADVVLVGAGQPQARLTEWCDALRPWAVTSVPAPLPAAAPELRPLSARIAGASLGLVMAGGGARAFAHLGVLAELAEAGITVDRVAGCSIGSVVAGLHASGRSPEDAIDLCYAEFVRHNPIGDYTLPTTSLTKGGRTRRAIDRHLSGRRIEALPHQFRAVSTDLIARTTVQHRSGDLGEAVKASLSLPVLFPPMRSGNTLLVDGGVLDNLPIGLLTERDEGPIVAVNISMGGGGSRGEGPPRMPALGETLLRTMMIGSGGATADATGRGIPVVTPPTLGVGLLEFHQLDRMVLAGRMAARDLLEATGGSLAVQPVSG